MTPSEFRGRVTVGMCGVIVGLAVPAAWLVGASAGVGVVAGGALALANFSWLVARAVAAAAGGGRGAAWFVGVAARFVILLAACAVLLASGWAHPVALLVGFSTLPCAVIAEGLRAARRQG